VAFLRRSPLVGIRTPRPYTGPELDVPESWVAFPANMREMPAYYRYHFDETSNLAVLSVEMLDLIYSTESLSNPLNAIEKARNLSERLNQWERNLPSCLAVNSEAAAHIMLLQ